MLIGLFELAKESDFKEVYNKLKSGEELDGNNFIAKKLKHLMEFIDGVIEVDGQTLICVAPEIDGRISMTQ